MAFLKKPQIRENQIRMRDHWYNMDPAYLYHGMYLGNCQGDTIEGNAIINYGDTTGAPYDWRFQLRGISLYNCNNSFVYFNKQAPALALNKLGTAVYTYGPNNNTIFRCNNFIGCKQGVFMDGSLIGDQGGVNDPWNNEWKSFASALRVDGINLPAVPLKWYFRGPTLLNDSAPFPHGSIPIDLYPNSIQVGNDTCGFPLPLVGGDSTGIEKLINDSILFPEFTNENYYANNDYAFNQLQENPDLRNSNTDFFDFYTVNLQTNIGYINEIETEIENENYTIAISKNSALQDTNVMETNLKTTNEIYLNNKIIGGAYTTAELSTLSSIGHQIPKTGGKAVYFTRAMTFEEVDDEIGTGRLQHSLTNETIVPIELIVLPNPSNGQIHLILLNDKTTQPTLNIKIFNYIGDVVYNANIKNVERVTQLNLHQLKAGAYTIMVTLNNNTYKTNKLIIIK